MTYLAKMFCNRLKPEQGRCHPSPPGASDSCQSRSRSPQSPDCCVETSWGGGEDDANIGFFVSRSLSFTAIRFSLDTDSGYFHEKAFLHQYFRDRIPKRSEMREENKSL